MGDIRCHRTPLVTSNVTRRRLPPVPPGLAPGLVATRSGGGRLRPPRGPKRAPTPGILNGRQNAGSTAPHWAVLGPSWGHIMAHHGSVLGVPNMPRGPQEDSKRAPRLPAKGPCTRHFERSPKCRLDGPSRGRVWAVLGPFLGLPGPLGPAPSAPRRAFKHTPRLRADGRSIGGRARGERGTGWRRGKVGEAGSGPFHLRAPAPRVGPQTPAVQPRAPSVA